MNTHENARSTPRSRSELVRRVLVERQAVSRVAADFGISGKTVRKWIAGFDTEGAAGLRD